MPPLCNSPIEPRNQSKIHYTLRVSPVPSSTILAGTASPLDRRITTGPGKLIPALFWTKPLCIHHVAIPVSLGLVLLFTAPALLKCLHACMAQALDSERISGGCGIGWRCTRSRGSRQAERMSSVCVQDTHRPVASRLAQHRRRTDSDDHIATPGWPAAARLFVINLLSTKG